MHRETCFGKVLTCAALAALSVTTLAIAPADARRRAQPDGASQSALVPLDSIDASIVLDMRYATARNFTGAPVPGYEAPACWLRPEVAKALSRVQADLAAADPPLSLKVFDCYRPERSVRSFMRWAASKEDGASRHYYPQIARSSLIPSGYIARASTHSRGIAVDLTITRRGGAGDANSKGGTSGEQETRPCTEAAPMGGELDMGTSFDCFDTRSHTSAGGLSAEQRQARDTLRRAMARRGFENYPREWWHFTYPAADDGRSFDVPVR
ncbi:MAG: M15 family metallopeptidase [Hyphomicrobiaceae bacterium]|nr:M15 family metallopeptidase [Hyphomicrobiaceae bacterium]